MVLVAMWHRETVLRLRAQESSVTGSKSQLEGKNLNNSIIHTHTPLNHYAVHLKLTWHCESAILQLKKKPIASPL